MILLFLAKGFEEVEALVPLDFLRRAGKTVFTVGVGGSVICGSHNIRITCDLTTEDVELCDELEGIILPGGMPGTRNLEADETVQQSIDYCVQRGLCIGAICAAPSVLGHKGLLDGRLAVCYPGFEKELGDYKPCSLPCAVDGNIITAQGAGAAMEFAFALTAYYTSEEAANALRSSVRWSN